MAIHKPMVLRVEMMAIRRGKLHGRLSASKSSDKGLQVVMQNIPVAVAKRIQERIWICDIWSGSGWRILAKK